jgi:HPt (histidine-containing phosphotransfer) domain-containing protein
VPIEEPTIETVTDNPVNLRIKGFDPQRLSEVAELIGDNEILLELITQFRTDYTDVITQLKHFLEQGELEKAKSLVHGLKGTASNLGANDIADAAKNLESRLKLEETAMTELDDLEQAWNAFMQYSILELFHE